MALSANTITPRPPLNLFEVERRQLQGSAWTTLLTVPSYYIPKNGPIVERYVNAAAIMTGLTITNIHNTTIRASARIRNSGNTADFIVIQNAPIPPNDFLIIRFDRQVMKSGETLEVSIPSNGTSANHAHTHFTYILNQREEFVTIAP